MLISERDFANLSHPSNCCLCSESVRELSFGRDYSLHTLWACPTPPSVSRAGVHAWQRPACSLTELGRAAEGGLEPGPETTSRQWARKQQPGLGFHTEETGRAGPWGLVGRAWGSEPGHSRGGITMKVQVARGQPVPPGLCLSSPSCTWGQEQVSPLSGLPFPSLLRQCSSLPGTMRLSLGAIYG